MDSGLTPKPSSSPGSLIARLEQANARAYEREQSAHKVLPADGEVFSSNPHPALEEPQVPLSTPGLDGGRASPGRPKRHRLFLSLFLLLCVGVAAIGWRISDDDVTRRKVAVWASQVLSNASQVLSNLARQMNVPTDQTSAADVSPKKLSRGPDASVEAVGISTEQARELERVLQSVASEIVVLRQGVEQLKTSQEQMARDDANIVELLKISQEQSARDNVQIADQLRANEEQITRVLSKTYKRNQRAFGAPVARNTRNNSTR